MIDYPFDSTYILKKKKALRRQLLGQGTDMTEKRIAVLSGVTIGDIEKVLELFLLDIGIKPVFYIGRYKRFYEQVMFENEKLVEFNPDIIIIHTTLRNTADGEITDKLEAVWTKIKTENKCPVIQNNFELPLYGTVKQKNEVNKHNLRISDYAEQNNDFYINDIQHISAVYGLNRWHSDRDYFLYKYGFGVSAIPLYCFELTKIIKAIYGISKKCLVLDLDNTLWGGEVGDAGTMGIELGPETAAGEAYCAFQRYVKQLGERGVILAVCSKNDESIARSAFNNPNMVLKLSDFAAFRANWESKADNIASIAEELNILPKSMVFIDDNPAEREIVRQMLPDVTVPEVNEVDEFIGHIEGAGYFYSTGVSDDDKNRNEYYAGNAKREELKKTFTDYGEYLTSLQMTSRIGSFNAENIERVTQLIGKTNQFNLTTLRLSRSEVESISRNSSYITLYATLDDKFGANGIVSALIGEIQDSSLHIRLWVMSCRVFERELEYLIFDKLAETCKDKGLGKIYGYYFPTEKNSYVKDLYKQLGFTMMLDGQWELAIDTDNKYEKRNRYILYEHYEQP